MVDVQLVRDLAASPQDVWDALTDVRDWGRWNPTLRRANGPLVVGTTVRMQLRLGPVWVPMRQEVEVVDAPRRLAWRSINGVRGFMDVDREFRLDPVDGGTRLTQQETATGPGAPVLMPLLHDLIRDGYAALAEALATRVARTAGTPVGPAHDPAPAAHEEEPG